MKRSNPRIPRIRPARSVMSRNYFEGVLFEVEGDAAPVWVADFVGVFFDFTMIGAPPPYPNDDAKAPNDAS